MRVFSSRLHNDKSAQASSLVDSLEEKVISI